MSAKFSATPGAIETPPPTLGQHQLEILGPLGYTADDLKALKEKMAI